MAKFDVIFRCRQLVLLNRPPPRQSLIRHYRIRLRITTEITTLYETLLISMYSRANSIQKCARCDDSIHVFVFVAFRMNV